MRGRAIPVPQPWSARPRSRKPNLGASMSTITPQIKRVMAVPKSFFKVKDSFRMADRGIMTATIKR